MTEQDKHNRFRGLLALGIIWLLGAVCDRIWFALDRSTPAWDQADYLTGTLNYWQALQQPQWFNSQWWTSFWQLSSKIPPLTYIAAAIIQNIFGTGVDRATLINLLFSAILLGSVYGLGVQLFSVEVGLWAAGICQLLPSLYRSRLEFLLDYPLTAVVALSFFCLTVWKATGKEAEEQGGRGAEGQRRGRILLSPLLPGSPLLRSSERRKPPLGLRAAPLLKKSPSLPQWLWAAAFGISFGLALLVKQTALFFLLTPVLWLGVGAIRRRRWQRVLQLLGGLLLSVVALAPWYRTNWLFVLTAGKRATVDAAIAEGDPALNTVTAWIYYWKILPYQVSWVLLIVPIVGLVLYIYWKRREKISFLSSLVWLAVFWIGAYTLSSLNINKDERYVLPYLPVVSIFLAYGLTRWGSRWGNSIRTGTLGLAIVLMFLNLFPVGGVLGNGIAQILSPYAQHHVHLGSELPHRQVIDEIIQTAPYIRSTLGVLPSTPEINQHNFNYYGALKNFQVYGRQVGTRQKHYPADARSLDWFLTKTGDQGSVPQAQAAITQIIERSPDFQLHKTWNLPDGSTLNLFHRRVPPLEVQPVQSSEPKISLLQVTVPETVPPGVPVPVTYKWTGSWEQLQSGLVLLNWHKQGGEGERWLHDHGIGMGTLHPSNPDFSRFSTYLVIERMAMLPPTDMPNGTYTLEATYLNRKTGINYSIPVPPVTLKIASESAPVPAPELDLLTQLRTLAAALPKGTEAVGAIFDEIGRINQYDPIQDYLVQAQQTLEYRLKLSPQNRDWAYALALSNVLQQRVDSAIAALERVTQLDSQNPYAYAYLAFVHLYNWHGSAAEIALKNARALNPNLPEIKALSGIAALMQGNLVQVWHTVQELTSRKT